MLLVLTVACSDSQEINHAHLFPTWSLVTSCELLEIGHFINTYYLQKLVYATKQPFLPTLDVMGCLRVFSDHHTGKQICVISGLQSFNFK